MHGIAHALTRSCTQAPEVTTQSSSNALTLAKRLKDAGAVMYGAFWCSHCFDQKQDFGVQAMADFPYVECFPEGWKKVRRGVRGLLHVLSKLSLLFLLYMYAALTCV